jgi:mycothiol synthase
VTGPVVLREVTADDAQDVLDLVTLCDIAETGEVLYTIDEVRADLTNVTLRAVAIDRATGGLAAYAWIDDRPGLGLAIGGVHVRPGSDWSVAPQLIAWMRATALTYGEGRPVHCFTSVGNPTLRGLYDAAGGEVVRSYFRMGIALSDELTPPAVGDGVEIRAVETEEDLRAVYGVVETAFSDHFAHPQRTFAEWRQGTADGACPDLGLWWLASVDGVPAAALFGFVAPATGYVDTLGTLREFRGRGLGAMLLKLAFAEFRRRGLPKAMLTVDATNPTGALGLYRSVGMVVEHEDLRYSLPA